MGSFLRAWITAIILTQTIAALCRLETAIVKPNKMTNDSQTECPGDPEEDRQDSGPEAQAEVLDPNDSNLLRDRIKGTDTRARTAATPRGRGSIRRIDERVASRELGAKYGQGYPLCQYCYFFGANRTTAPTEERIKPRQEKTLTCFPFLRTANPSALSDRDAVHRKTFKLEV